MGEETPPPKRRAWDTLSRHLRRKTHNTDAQAPPPPEAQAPPPVPEPSARVTQPIMPDEARRALDAPPDKGGASPLPAWKTDAFKLTEEQAKREFDPKVQMTRLIDHARKRPVVSTLVLLTAVGILVMDALLIARKMGVDEWLMINFELGKDESRRFEVWERRGTGLSYLSGAPGQEQEVSDPNQAGAVDGKDKLPDKPLETPKLSGGLAGIITPEELRREGRASFVGGLDASVKGDPNARSPLSGAFVKTADDDFRPYSPAASGAGLPIPTGAFFGEAGDALENFASISNASKPAADYASPDLSAMREVPQGLTGDDLVLAMIGEDFKKDLKQYAKEGKWKLHKKDPAEKTVRHELEGLSLTGNNAVLQLLQTKQSTDVGLRCSTCNTERRIHNTRAPFYGEEH
ncbi:MAG: hypothetical protein HY928_10900 [Elusimicrobia bacterium]|nr:hypothetical protein [Elusimicrobiota bacterium]